MRTLPLVSQRTPNKPLDAIANQVSPFPTRSHCSITVARIAPVATGESQSTRKPEQYLPKPFPSHRAHAAPLLTGSSSCSSPRQPVRRPRASWPTRRCRSRRTHARPRYPVGTTEPEPWFTTPPGHPSHVRIRSPTPPDHTRHPPSSPLTHRLASETCKKMRAACASPLPPKPLKCCATRTAPAR